MDTVLDAEPENVVALLVRAGPRSVDNDVEGVLADVDVALEIEPQNVPARLFTIASLRSQYSPPVAP